MDEKTHQPIDEQYGYEATAVAIDKYKLLKKTNNQSNE